MFLYLPHFNCLEKYLTSSKGIISSLSGLCQYKDNRTFPTIEKLTAKDNFHSSLPNISFCFDLPSITSSALAKSWKKPSNFAIGISYQPAFLSNLEFFINNWNIANSTF